MRKVPVIGRDVAVVWADGHDHGVCLFGDLRQACPCEECTGVPDSAG